MGQRHKHADVIIAWANGEEVEYRAIPGHGEWQTFPITAITWRDVAEYRIKPKEEDVWKPCASGRLRFIVRSVGVSGSIKVLQQMMVNQNAEYEWIDVPVGDEKPCTKPNP